MCKGLLSHENPGAIEVRLAVLATSRFAGFAVWTEEAKPKKKKTVEEKYVSLLSDLDLDEEDLAGEEDLNPEDRASLVRAIIDLKFGSASGMMLRRIMFRVSLVSIRRNTPINYPVAPTLRSTKAKLQRR